MYKNIYVLKSLVIQIGSAWRFYYRRLTLAQVLLEKISKVYDNGFKAVDAIDLKIEDKEFVVLVGPSGCGKSTTLRMIAGLESISGGALYIGDELVNLVQPKDRDIAMVFQSYALYPHMSVRDNIAFALKIDGVKKKERYAKVDAVSKILQLEGLLDKKPGTISGGQRQRVALGRAMVRNPKVFLLDEPLSNLDAKLRVTMRSEIVALHRELETTFIYVTHDQTEAMTMGDRIAVMSNGKVEQFDTPGNLYYNPVNLFVAEFIGSPQMNIFDGVIVKNPKPTVILGQLQLDLPQSVLDRLNVDGDKKEVLVGIRSENIHYATDTETAAVKVTAKNVEQVGSDTFVYFDLPFSHQTSVARFNPPRQIAFNETIGISFDMEQVNIFDKETGINLLDKNQVDHF